LIITVLSGACLETGQARGGSAIAVTFDEPQLVNNDPLLTFYDGGTTYRGIGGGPNLGVAFSLNARVFTQTSGLTGTFTPPGVMELYSDTARDGEGISAIMDVAGGIQSGVQFSYAAIDADGRVRVYSGLDGAGTLLADVTLPITSPQTGPGVFVADSVQFSGVAQSIVIDGGNKQLAFDDLTTFSAVPEPLSLSLLAIGCVLWVAASRVSAITRRQVRRG
jgi:hypothetical protein